MEITTLPPHVYRELEELERSREMLKTPESAGRKHYKKTSNLSKEERKQRKRERKELETLEERKARKARKARKKARKLEKARKLAEEQQALKVDEAENENIPETQFEMAEEEIEAQIKSQLLLERSLQSASSTEDDSPGAMTPKTSPCEPDNVTEAPKFTPVNINTKKKKGKRKASPVPDTSTLQSTPKRKKKPSYKSTEIIEDSDHLANSDEEDQESSVAPNPLPFPSAESFTEHRIKNRHELYTSWDTLTAQLNTSAEMAYKSARGQRIYHFRLNEMIAMHNFIHDYAQLNDITPEEFASIIWDKTPTSGGARRKFWSAFFTVLPEHPRNPMVKYVRKFYNFFTSGAKWSEDQDKELTRMVLEQGTAWAKIARIIGRHPDDCRDRWRNYLQYGNKRNEGEWSEAEKNRFKQVMKELLEQAERGEDVRVTWTLVAEKMGGIRSRTQCRDHWLSITRDEKFEIPKALYNARSLGVKKTDGDLGPQMKVGDKIWLLEGIVASGVEYDRDVPWHTIAEKSSYWTISQLVANYNKLKLNAPRKPGKCGLKLQLQKLLEELNDLPEIMRKERYQP